MEELQIKKAKKKKKKKHKEGEKHKQVKMYHRSCQTMCAGLLLLPPSSPPQSPFKSPLPVLPPSNNKNSHLLPSSLPLASKAFCISSLHDPLSSPIKKPHTSPTKHPLQCSYPRMAGLEFAPYIHIENQPNGGALVAHAYTSQLSSLSIAQRERFAQEFVTLAFSEDTSQACIDQINPHMLPISLLDVYLNLRLTMFSRQLTMLWGSSTEKLATCLTFWTTFPPSSLQPQSKWKYWERKT